MVKSHPRINGKGSHARIATDLLMTDYFDHLIIDWSAGYDLQNDTTHRKTYIVALRQADKGAFDPLLPFAGACLNYTPHQFKACQNRSSNGDAAPDRLKLFGRVWTPHPTH